MRMVRNLTTEMRMMTNLRRPSSGPNMLPKRRRTSNRMTETLKTTGWSPMAQMLLSSIISLTKMNPILMNPKNRLFKSSVDVVVISFVVDPCFMRHLDRYVLLFTKSGGKVIAERLISVVEMRHGALLVHVNAGSGCRLLVRTNCRLQVKRNEDGVGENYWPGDGLVM